MARVWVTGSADGIGREAASLLVANGHQVVLHARDERRAEAAAEAVPGASGVVGDLSSLASIRALADDVAGRGPFDAIIHNAGVLESGARDRTVTVDGLELTWAVNVVAPYLLTALLPRPARLVYLSSEMHRSGRPDLGDAQWARRPFRGSQAYSDSKLAVTALAFAVAARHPDVLSNAVDPGWVRSRMGGAGAPVSLAAGAATPVRLATSDDPAVRVTARYFTSGQARPGPPGRRRPRLPGRDPRRLRRDHRGQAAITVVGRGYGPGRWVRADAHTPQRGRWP